ncbi:uracil-DNA glycosylase [Reinekea blandensis]|uniref:Uracil-DNA glycosylase n=1 Tax=Reinekea blandensis MED297 TaxID=314283 RepID=A4BI34_9GAMM|nr:uracil-DNA glycosylase [Reinekea blandensis]EAR08177.1 uracil-DNA glycosylase [Reinekea sp. MED297] [Reinekea blandensis MED297]
MIFNTLTSQHWQTELRTRVEPAVLQELSQFLQQQINQQKTIYPPEPLWFEALNRVSPDQVKVVILGQDPYHGPGQAQGLSFSVPADQTIPPSLRNIFRELSTDLQIDNHCGDLTVWAKQGVLLLNTVLTVEAGQPNSHAGQGWERITDAVLETLNEQAQPIVFMLWGAHAQKKATRLNERRHCILTAPHPSPLSAHRGFFGCAHFSLANRFLTDQGQSAIDWRTGETSQPSLF